MPKLVVKWMEKIYPSVALTKYSHTLRNISSLDTFTKNSGIHFQSLNGVTGHCAGVGRGFRWNG